MNIRKAATEDAEQIRELLIQLGYDVHIGLLKQRITNYDDLSHELIVAVNGKTILGFIAFNYFASLVAGRCCHIDALIIDKQHRGLGIGKQLMHYAEAKAAQHQCSAIDLITYNFRKKDGTHDFYQKLGYKNHIESDYTYFCKENL